MSTYGQYCPLAIAAEVLCERWNLLIVSRIVDGCHRFNDIHKGVPKISATLLSSRLRILEMAGLITKTPLETGRGHDYQLTDAGRALDPIIMDLAAWGQAWGRDMVFEDLDPAFLLWSMHTRLDTDAMPKGRTVLAFEFSGAPRDCSRFWLVCDDGDVEMCLKDPGFETDLSINADLRTFTEAWRGFRDLRTEIANGNILIDGPSHLARQFPKWLMLSALAGIERHRDGQEKNLV